jgi:hypothetical protein
MWVSAATTAAVGLAGAAIAPYVSARLVTNPEFVRWLVKSGTQMGKNPNSVKYHLGRLLEISSRDSQFREDALSYIEALGGAIIPSEAEAATIEQPIEDVDITQSSALQSLLQAMTPAQRAKIQQAVP